MGDYGDYERWEMKGMEGRVRYEDYVRGVMRRGYGTSCWDLQGQDYGVKIFVEGVLRQCMEVVFEDIERLREDLGYVEKVM